MNGAICARAAARRCWSGTRRSPALTRCTPRRSKRGSSRKRWPVSRSATLDSIQSWMQNFIVDPGDDEVVSQEQEQMAVTLVAPSATLSAVERVFVYRDQYLARME